MGVGTFLLLALLAILSNAIVFTALFSVCVSQLFNYHIEILNFQNILAVFGLMILANALD